MIKVSVILPSLNVAAYIEKCLDSVKNQTLQEIEIICVDAGSTDGTLDVLKEFQKKDSRIKVIMSDKKSYGYQINLGLKSAMGEYVGIVETDDFVDPEFYEKLYTQSIYKKVDFIKMGFKESFEYKGKMHYYNRISNATINCAGDVIDLTANRGVMLYELNHIWSGIYRREFLKKNKICLNETSGASYQDISFFILVGLLANTCIYVNECLYNYRIDNPASSVKENKKWKCVMDEYEFVDSFLTNNYLDTILNKTIVSEMKIITYLWNCLRLSDESKKLFFECIQMQMLEIYNNKKIWMHLTADTREKYELLISYEKLIEHENKTKKLCETYRSFIKEVKDGKRYVVMCAGKHFKELCFIQEVLDVKFIEAVCDNSISLKGKEIKGYIIADVQEIEKKIKSLDWIIANQKYSHEITSQLQMLGIDESRIIVFNQILGHDRLLSIIYDV